MLGDEVIGDSFQPFLFQVWHWLPHMPRHCVNTLRGIVKYRANSTTTAIIAVGGITAFVASNPITPFIQDSIAVGQMKPFEVGRERALLREVNWKRR
ncbi:hypothetical protein AVEN_248121-1 [Araneus ventricosus]|uniref:Uncharacterized protein n=1 Tax=Araneus ventricosus TaxID=182803 RepID=A0A4Y2SNH8_ARAVE|nr:hypothetical protein AVEN_148770-1 [Araneus ventricosus]GBN89076.1 hypothetical protein AVEN_248121-1 [Araneus ventricosus]